RLLKYCQALCAAGLDFLVIHPRTDSQKFRRSPHREVIGALSRDLPVPIVGNGDIASPGAFRQVMGEQKPYALMIGREAVRRPWIFRLIRGSQATPIDLLQIGLRFLELQEAMSPIPFQLESARRFFSYYCDNFKFAQYLKVKLNNASSLSMMASLLGSYFDEVPDDRLLPPASC
ncbi:MAG: tRNA-dihydrouridine synthase, partial [Spirochaetaceae bacterium]|nr:tRNA-dihydrouridine synthase [Spirochaetaceae bacterium]